MLKNEVIVYYQHFMDICQIVSFGIYFVILAFVKLKKWIY